MSGYSGTPLAVKLGIKPAYRIKTRNAPADYRKLLAPIPDKVTISPRLRGPVDIWHLFTRSRFELARLLAQAIGEIPPNGMIWVSWPKKASGVASDVSEDTVREIALPLGLVDIKVCAVDDTWSGLKLVVRRDRRWQTSLTPPRE